MQLLSPFIELSSDLYFCLDGIERDKVNEESIKLLKEKFDEVGKAALGITIATSPYFLEQNIAIDILNKIFS